MIMMSYLDCSDHWHIDIDHVSVSMKALVNNIANPLSGAGPATEAV